MKKIFKILVIGALMLASCTNADMGSGAEDVGNEINEDIVTGGVYDITYTGAGIFGYFNLPAEMMTAVKFGILYSTSPNLTTSNGTFKYASGLNSERRFDVFISDLNPGTTYYYCACIKYMTENYLCATVRSFKTPTFTVSINDEATNITHNSATISGKFIANAEVEFPKTATLYDSSDGGSYDNLKS